ncbi:glycerophosphodiester phosphodiesterase family protein [Microlunatus speluncae]|uniref:glycerophosphodiester phosphodiesterase family protein n=1 Tax=Microlunatus speluncae TaxID=2594267 RepID=UPI001FE473D8|nr:glycerophosphodiester phosphodiesterase family protein [Microlunatus speluncae]
MNAIGRNTLTLIMTIGIALPLISSALIGFAPATPATAAPATRFDLQAHRGGLGLTVESTLSAFGNALRLGVSTLELDVQITADGHAVVTHDRKISGSKCADTAPYSSGDPEYPYVGKYIKNLTLAQVRQLDCGSQTLPGYPGQQADPGARMPELRDVFDLVRRHRADSVKLNIETKVEAGAPEETAPREQFVQVVAAEVRKARIARQVTIQSFDWGALMRMRKVAPELPIVALTNRDFLQVGQSGASPWLGGIDIDDFDGNLIRAVKSFGADAVSPVHGFPQGGTVGDPDYRPYVDAAMVRQAHRARMKIIPWTVDDPATMRSLIELGVDGIISDYPDRLRTVMKQAGLRLPPGYPAPRVVPLAQAHAHNDYEHAYPLADALDRGFSSVEADVWLVDGELRVAHDLDQTEPGVTLQKLYLEPLAARAQQGRGSIYPAAPGAPFQLLIDIKSDGPATYAAIDRALRDHDDVFSRFTAAGLEERAVTAVISGNRPLAVMQAQPDRFAGFDGRLSDLGGDLTREIMPLVSDNWTNHFSWTGQGGMPAAERTKLRAIVARAHAAGFRLRFWATPDVPGAARNALWSELLAAGVDHLNTDDLHGLDLFLREQRA